MGEILFAQWREQVLVGDARMIFFSTGFGFLQGMDMLFGVDVSRWFSWMRVR